MRRVLVTGARSAVGGYLLSRLRDASCAVVAVSRGTAPAGAWRAARWLQADLGRDPPPQGPFWAWVHLAPLDLLGRWLDAMDPPPARLVAFGTTSVLTKADSPDPAERARVGRLLQAEERLRTVGSSRGMAWTLFRPTMIYGGGRDRNVAFIADWVRRWRFFPLVGDGGGLRQPVHADDLAAACMAVLDNPRTEGRTYELGGGEVLRYRAMVDRIFEAQGLRPRYLPVPEAVLAAAVRVAARLPGLGFLSPAMVRRMGQDLVFDHGPAIRDFGYAPRPFRPQAVKR